MTILRPIRIAHRDSVSTRIASGMPAVSESCKQHLHSPIRVTSANPMGIACDYRVVLHELGGHGVLYNHVNSANFGFAHSAGDSIAAVLNDAGSQAPDRFVTFPWVNIRPPA